MVKTIREITTEELKEKLLDKNVVVLDTRVSEAYMGHKISENETAGHIRGAMAFSADWLAMPYDEQNNIEKITKEEVLEKQIQERDLQDKTVVLYDSNGEDHQKVHHYLRNKIAGEFLYYDMRQWDEEPVRYPRYDLYMPAQGLKNLDDQWKIFHVDMGEQQESHYMKRHLPGAVYLNALVFEPIENGGRLLDDRQMMKIARNLGIACDSKVLLTSEDPLVACRVAATLYYLGVSEVAVLDGGLPRADHLGIAFSAEEEKPHPVALFGTETPGRPETIYSTEMVKEKLANGEIVLVDNRTAAEYNGEISGSPMVEKKGRIEGAVFGFAGLNSPHSMFFYRNPDQTMKEGDLIIRRFEAQDIRPNDDLVFMCAAGWRAAEVFWDMLCLGYDNIHIYSDSWFGWSA